MIEAMSYYLSPLKLVALASILGISIAPSLLSESAIASDNTGISSTDAQELAQATSTGDIVDVASSDPNFSTLVQAVQEADLVDTLQGEGPFTVFAPTNAAFNDLPAGTLDALLQPENEDLLTEVLTYHVVPGEVTSDELETGVVDTLNGGVAVNVSPGRVVVNNASVIQADVPASNGVIHAINRVLIPQGVVAELQARSSSAPVRGLW